MKKNICLITGLMLLIFISSSTCFAADKIGFINLREIMQNSTAGKKAGEELSKFADSKKKSIVDMDNSLKKMKEEIEKQSSVMKESVRRDKETAYQRKLRDFQLLVDDTNAELQKRNQEITQKLIPEIDKAVRAIAEKEKYTVILDITQVAYFDKVNDISKKVIDEFNKTQK
jgi:outer membrane protein